MKILQVITLLSADGAFGGPFAVAWDQCLALHELGHDVTLVTGWDGAATVPPGPFEVEPFRLHKLLPGSGVSGLFSAAMIARVRRLANQSDAVHVHMGRDAVSALAARAACGNARTYIQCHGMVMPDRRLRARAVDFLATRKVLRSAKATFYLTGLERRGLAEVSNNRAQLVELRNGISSDSPPYRLRYAPNDPPSVLFCARLHERKRVMAFAEMAKQLQQRRQGIMYFVAGPDEGDLPSLRNFMRENSEVHLTYLGALSSAAARTQIGKSDVYVLPSVNEPFPMTVLEALASGTPTVLTTSCGISAELASTNGACVTDGSPDEMANAVERLLADDVLYASQSQRGRSVMKDRFSIESVAHTLETTYEAGRFGISL